MTRRSRDRAAVVVVRGDQPLPSAVVAERELLAALLSEPEGVPAVRERIGHESVFWDERNSAVWSAMERVWTDHGELDAVLLAEELKRADPTGETADYIVSAAEAQPNAGTWPHYLEVVIDAARRRRIAQEGDRIGYAARNGQDTEEIAQQAVLGIATAVRGVERSGGPVLQWGSSVETRAIRWLWPHCIPLGKITVLAGDPGVGKSFLSLQFAATATAGNNWPDGSLCRPCGVLLASAEDDAEDTILPRFVAMGGNPKRLAIFNGVKGVDPDKPGESAPFTLEMVSALEEAVAAVPECGLVVIDPIGAFMGKADAHSNAEVRALMAPIADMAARLQVAVLVVSHLNKSGGTKSVYRVTGSLGLPAAARIVWMACKDQNNPADRLLLCAKSNISVEPRGFSYRIAGDPAVVEWSGRVEMDADQGLSQPDAEFDSAAVGFLRELLAPCAQPAAEVKAQAKDAGIKPGDLDNARHFLRVAVTKQGFQGKWYWELPR